MGFIIYYFRKENKMDIKWLTNLSVAELERKANELTKPYKKFEINGIAVCDNQNIKEIEGEVFKNHPIEKDIEVSNLGRVKLGEKILAQYIPDDDENLYVEIPSIRSKKRVKVYRLIAETWCENPNMDFYNHVHHISNNWYDNRKENLLWVTEAQHAKIHPFMLKGINGICVQFGPGINQLVKSEYLFDEIIKINKERKGTKIKYVGTYYAGKEYDIKSGEYKIYVYDELKYSDEIPDDLLSIIEAGNLLEFLRVDIKYKKENIFEFYKDYLEKGALKNIVKFSKESNRFEIDPSFNEQHEKCKKEVTKIIVSHIKEITL
jgi:hypothetical protein